MGELAPREKEEREAGGVTRCLSAMRSMVGLVEKRMRKYSGWWRWTEKSPG
jgi:hypothetical protein